MVVGLLLIFIVIQFICIKNQEQEIRRLEKEWYGERVYRMRLENAILGLEVPEKWRR